MDTIYDCDDLGPCPACAGTLNGTLRDDKKSWSVACDSCGHVEYSYTTLKFVEPKGRKEVR